MVHNLPEMQGTQVQSLGWEDPLEEDGQPTLVHLVKTLRKQGVSHVSGNSLYKGPEAGVCLAGVGRMENAVWLRSGAQKERRWEVRQER